jgi:hypothetical protein
MDSVLISYAYPVASGEAEKFVDFSASYLDIAQNLPHNL